MKEREREEEKKGRREEGEEGGKITKWDMFHGCKAGSILTAKKIKII